MSEADGNKFIQIKWCRFITHLLDCVKTLGNIALPQQTVNIFNKTIEEAAEKAGLKFKNYRVFSCPFSAFLLVGQLDALLPELAKSRSREIGL